MKLRELNLVSRRSDLREIPAGKILINTINAYSYVCAQKDEEFAEALMGGDYLVPDGVSIVMATRFVGNPNPPQQRVPGWDVFMYEMEKLHSSKNGGKRKTVMFMGSSEHVLSAIRERVAREYPGLGVITYSPPFKEEFSEEDSARMVAAVNNANPDLLLIGMTAPKQEKWVSRHWRLLDINCNVCTIGAIFDFYAGTSKRAPLVMQKFGLEWLHRLCSDPCRMWRRYIIGNTKFVIAMLCEKLAPGKRKVPATPSYNGSGKSGCSVAAERKGARN